MSEMSGYGGPFDPEFGHDKLNKETPFRLFQVAAQTLSMGGKMRFTQRVRVTKVTYLGQTLVTLTSMSWRLSAVFRPWHTHSLSHDIDHHVLTRYSLPGPLPPVRQSGVSAMAGRNTRLLSSERR